MRDGRARVCVATDVAARGIDLPNLELVVHAELPANAEGLLHRSGRTGRAGRKGTSVLIVPPKIARKAERLLASARLEAEWTTAPSADEILRRDEERLLADPVWTEDTTEEEEAFATKLLAQHGPVKIAAAYLRLYRSRQSAPEDSVPPDTRPPQKARRSFEPGAWFALSVGRDDRAEPRWLLPLICRAGDVDKDAIGAIRVQQTETLVELSIESTPRFLAALGGRTEIEKGIGIRQLEGPPDQSGRGSTAPVAAPTPPAAPKSDHAVAAAPEPEVESRSSPRAAPVPPEVVSSKVPEEPAAPPRKPRHGPSSTPAKPSKPRTAPTQAGGRPGGTSSAKLGGKRAGSSEGRRPDAGKFARRRASGKPAAGLSDASDTSKRFTPPGKTDTRKPGSKPRAETTRRSKDGGGPPRRGKR